MKRFSLNRLLLRTLYYYRKEFLFMALAVSICAMIISGSLILGNSVRRSLEKVAENAVGKIQATVFANKSWLRIKTIENADKNSPAQIEPLAFSRAFVTNFDESVSKQVSLLGVTSGFFSLASDAFVQMPPLKPFQAAINRNIAKSLKINAGDRITLRFLKTSQVPQDAPFSLSKNSIETVSLEIAFLIEETQGGNFNPFIAHQLPFNLFVDIDFFNDLFNRSNRANMAVSDMKTGLMQRLKKEMNLEDFGLVFQPGKERSFLRSESVFLEDRILKFIEDSGFEHDKNFTYFVDDIMIRNKSVPYSFIAGAEGVLLPTKIESDQIVFNSWLAQQLNAKIGDKVLIRAKIPGRFGEFGERTDEFILSDVVPIGKNKFANQLIMNMPGIKNAETCSDWNPDLPVDTSRISSADEEYWYDYKGLPKAFINIKKAREIWAGRFGSLTMISFPGSKSVSKKLLEKLKPENLGFSEKNLILRRKNATGNALDFGMLFLGLGLFVIVAALLLLNLLFSFYIERRFNELAIMQVCGFSRGMLIRQLLGECAVISFFGAVAGSVAGIFYALIKIVLVSTFWRGALNFNELSFYFNHKSLLISVFATLIVCLISVMFGFRRFFLSGKTKALSGETQFDSSPEASFKLPAFVFLASIVFWTFEKNAVFTSAIFFFSGFAGLILSTQLFFALMIKYSKKYRCFSEKTLIWKNILRKFSKSKAVVRVLACAVFLIVGISANHRQELPATHLKTSGTGGFSIFAKTAVPVSGDLNMENRRLRLKLDEISQDTSLVQLPLIEGSEASCLNLNAVENPSIAGIEPVVFQDRFAFAWQLDKVSRGWECLNDNSDEDVIFAIADSEVILWSLGLQPGGEMHFEGSDGKVYRIKFVGGLENSIFQGMILISNKNLYKLSPQTGGSRIILAETSGNKLLTELKVLSRALSRYGAQIENTAKRIARFNRVQNTYLSMFLTLGAISLLLGCAGLAALLQRNLYDRRKEIKYLRVIGFSKKMISNLVFKEHLLLFSGGIFTGLIAALIAIIPVFQSPQGNVPIAPIFLALLLLILTGIITLIASIKHSIIR